MHDIIIFVVGLIAGFLGATVGGGGMVAIPALLFLGFSPQSAIAVNAVGDIGAFISATGEYWRSKKIDWKMAVPLAVIATVGSIIGTQIMVRLDTDFLRTFIGVMILLFLPFFFFGGKTIGLRRTNPSNTSKFIGFVLYALLVTEGAIVGAGGSTVILLIMMYFFGYEIVRGYATNTPADLLSSIVPAVVYSFYGFVAVVPALIIFIGMLIGGFVGANTALKKGSRWVKNLFTLVIIASVIKILFF
jgi:uncharacterized membrane protein YfcA